MRGGCFVSPALCREFLMHFKNDAGVRCYYLPFVFVFGSYVDRRLGFVQVGKCGCFDAGE